MARDKYCAKCDTMRKHCGCGIKMKSVQKMTVPFEAAWNLLKGDPNLIQQPGRDWFGGTPEDAHSGSIQPVVAQMIDRMSQPGLGMGHTGMHGPYGPRDFSRWGQHYAPYDTPGTEVSRTAEQQGAEPYTEEMGWAESGESDKVAEAWRAPHFDVMTPDEAYEAPLNSAVPMNSLFVDWKKIGDRPPSIDPYNRDLREGRAPSEYYSGHAPSYKQTHPTQAEIDWDKDVNRDRVREFLNRKGRQKE